MVLQPALADIVPSAFSVTEICELGAIVWAPVTSVATMVTPSRSAGSDEAPPRGEPAVDAGVLTADDAAALPLVEAPAAGGVLLLAHAARPASIVIAAAATSTRLARNVVLT